MASTYTLETLFEALAWKDKRRAALTHSAIESVNSSEPPYTKKLIFGPTDYHFALGKLGNLRESVSKKTWRAAWFWEEDGEMRLAVTKEKLKEGK